MIPIYRARHDCRCMAIVVVQIAKKNPKELPCTKFHINCSDPTHSQPAAAKTNSFENYFAAKKNSFEVITRLYPFETFPECNYKYILPAENTFFIERLSFLNRSEF